MDPLHRQAIVQGVLGTLLFAVLNFWPAGTFHYWQGWLFLGLFAASTVGFTVSFLFIFRVTRVNSFAAANIRVEKNQRVIDTGPYAYVRHPMYAGAIWLLVGMPLALGSWRSLVLILAFVPVLLWRLLDEERIMQRDLPGYAECMRRVRSRLVPFVW